MAGEILLIDKPKGITSFDVIRILRKKLGIKKMGHAGTLDPLATGLMIVATDEKTKTLSSFLKLDKTYEVRAILGIETDTLDVTGKVLEKRDLPLLSKEQVIRAVDKLKGVHNLSVPLYSAIKRQGQPLYSYARKGLMVELPVKEMEVFYSRCISYDSGHVSMILSVSSGTYIRSLIKEFARFLGTIATVEELRRTQIGDFKVTNAEKLTI